MRFVLHMLSVFVLASSVGCTGPSLFDRQSWLFGKDAPDDPALLAKIGPTPMQRIALVRSLREKMNSTPAEAESVAAELATRIQTETDSTVRVEIVKALGDSKSQTAKAVLKAGLGYPRPDPDAEVRQTICQVWGRIGGDEGRAMLSSALANDTDGDVRVEAARSLGSFKGGANVQALAAALEDQDLGVRHTAMQSMKSASGQDFGDDIRAWREYAKSGSVKDETPSIASKIWPWH